MDIFFSSAIAQEAGAAGSQNPIMNFVPFILIFVVLYFLMIRPQKKKLEQEQKFNSEIKRGDEVITRSGMIGRIEGMTEKVITLEVADNVRIKFLRSQIQGSAKTLAAKADK